MNVQCPICKQEVPETRDLVHIETGDHVSVCATCLRTMSHAKAARSDDRSYRRLLKAAERDDQEIWRSKHVVYLFPSIAPLAQQRRGVPVKPPTPATDA